MAFTITDYKGTTHTLRGEGVIDFKHPIHSPKNPEELHYILQIQGQIDCVGADWGILAFLTRTTSEWVIVVSHRHEPTIQAIRKAVDVFWDHMANDTDYPPVTNQEANRYYKSNHFNALDLTDGPTEEIKSEGRGHLIDAAETYLAAQRAVKAGQECMDKNALIMKHIMGGVEKVILPDNRSVSFTEVNYKAQPEKTVPGKGAYTSRRFKVQEN